MRSLRIPFVLVLIAVLSLLLAIAFRYCAAEPQANAPSSADDALRVENSSESILGLPEPSGRVPAGSNTATVPQTVVHAVTGGLEIVALDPSRAPLANAMLVLFRGENVLGQQASAADGTARFAASGGSCSYVIFASGWEISGGELELQPGRRTVMVSEGATLAGRVLVDGAAPIDPFELAWECEARMPGVFLELPWNVGRLVGNRNVSPRVLKLHTNKDGWFEVRGLPADADGALRWDAACFFEQGGDAYDARRLEVRELRRDLLLPLVSGIEIVFRVVDFAGEPMLGANASVELRYEQPELRRSYSLDGDREGRMALALLRGSVAPIRVSVGWVQSSTPRSYDFDPPPDLRGTWNLGDLAALETRPITVTVKDEEGQPILDASATAWLPRSEDAIWATVGQRGRAIVDVSTGSCEVAARAFGYCGATVKVPPKTWYVTVTLARTCALELETSTEFEPADDIQLEIRGPSPMFVDEDPDSPEAERVDSGDGKLTSRDGTTKFRIIPWITMEWTTHVLPRQQGRVKAEREVQRWRIGALIPNQPLHAIVFSHGKELCDTEIAPLSPGEHRRVTLQMPSKH